MNKKLFIITLGRASQMILMFVTYRVLSHLFSVEEMGGYYFLLSIAGAFGLIFANPLGMFANRKIHEWKAHGKLNLHLKNLTLVYFLGTLLTIPFLFIFREKLTNVNIPISILVSILIFYVFTNTMQSTLIPTLNLLGEATHFVVYTFLSTIIALIFSYILVHFYTHDPMFWLLGQGLSFTVFAIVAYIVIARNYPDKKLSSDVKEKDSVRGVLKFAIPIAFTNIFVWSMAQSFRFFLKDKINPTTLGEMTFGLGLATSLSVAVEYLFQQLFLPKFYQDLGANLHTKERAWNIFLNKVLPSYVIYCVYLFGLSPFLMRVLADAKFKNASHYLALGAFVEFFRMTSNVATMATHAQMKTEKALIPYLIGGGFTLVSVLYISNHESLIGFTPYVLGIGYALSCLFLFLSVRNFFKVNIHLATLFQYALLSIIFLIPILFLRSFSNSLINSIAICFVFGLILLFFFYRQYKLTEGESA